MFGLVYGGSLACLEDRRIVGIHSNNSNKKVWWVQTMENLFVL